MIDGPDDIEGGGLRLLPDGGFAEVSSLAEKLPVGLSPLPLSYPVDGRNSRLLTGL